AIYFPELFLHDPERRIVSAAEFPDLPRKPLANAWVGILLVASPALKDGLAHAIKAGSIALEIAPEGPVEEPLRVVTGNSAVQEVEFVLTVDVGVVHVGEQTTFSGDLLVKWRAGNRRVEHELMEVGLVVDGG